MANHAVLGLTVAVAAGMVAACTSTVVQRTPTLTQSPVVTESAAPSISTEPTLTPTTSTPSPMTFLAPVGPRCSASQLEVRTGMSGAGLGNGVSYIIFTDRGTAPCVLRGTPGVQLLDERRRVLIDPHTQDLPMNYVPTMANGGVGLIPLTNEGAAPGPNPEGGIRGQASLPVQYYDDGCDNNLVAALRITLPGGTLTIPFSLPGGGPGCNTSVISINPFQPAEFAP